MDTRPWIPREGKTVQSPQGCLKGVLRAAQTLRQDSRNKCDQEPAGGGGSGGSLSGLGGVVPKVEGGPDAFEGPLTSIWVPSNEYDQSSCPFICSGGHKYSARIGAEVPSMLPSQGSSSYKNQTGPQSILSSLSWLEEGKTCPPGAPVWLGRWLSCSV